MYLHQAEADLEKLTMGPDWLFVCFLMYFPICLVISKSWHCPVKGHTFFLRLLMYVTKPFSREGHRLSFLWGGGKVRYRLAKLGNWGRLGRDGVENHPAFKGHMWFPVSDDRSGSVLETVPWSIEGWTLSGCQRF